MSLPKISIITVVRNAPQDLEKTLLSVRAQGLPNVEYIVRDGASTDDAMAVADDAMAVAGRNKANENIRKLKRFRSENPLV
jgi:glycosyltransferase involved in cell wall biosynthesis